MIVGMVYNMEPLFVFVSWKILPQVPGYHALSIDVLSYTLVNEVTVYLPGCAFVNTMFWYQHELI